MKIKNIAAICKKNKYAVIYERYGESGGVIQYIGGGRGGLSGNRASGAG